MSRDWEGSLRGHMLALYGEAAGSELARALLGEAAAFRAAQPRPAVAPGERLSASDAFLISYPDQVRRQGEPPLASLKALLDGPLAGTVSGVHVLPFHPASSDDGFAVVDYRAVDPAFGDWRQVEALAASYRLMIDAVINHVSASSGYLRRFLAGDPAAAGFFREVPADADLRAVVRPRATPLATTFTAADGRSHALWTTFGADQVDLDYATPAVFLEVARVLLGYLSHGAQALRLDAVTYLWKEPGTSCASLPQTHRLLEALRAFLELAAPWVVMLTETNVPHAENVAYFGDGDDEAQLVYNFALPPLVLHSAATGDAGALRRWAGTLATPSRQTAFFNFLASHDGIGLRALEGLVDDDAVARLADLALARGGHVSRRATPDGERPYELNINYFDALTPPGEAVAASVRRFATAHAVMLALAGVPAVYVHSLLGSRGAPHEVRRTGRARSINREKLGLEALLAELADAEGRRARVLAALSTLIRARRAHPAFDPFGAQQVLPAEGGVFALRREAGGRAAWCLHNLSGQPARFEHPDLHGRATDLLAGGERPLTRALALDPWQTLWLEPMS
ncbi:MAG TPA: alpha-amylase family glycosyl hydrolase [Trueperaceae bacterium]|nr:alpha-amylase family glycosyl hydrolase [Trueperaceae bacterium]